MIKKRKKIYKSFWTDWGNSQIPRELGEDDFKKSQKERKNKFVEFYI